MYGTSLLAGLGLLLPVLTIAAPSPSIEERQLCTFNSATNPTCWDGTYDLSSNYYLEGPDTGVVREYWFEVTNSTMALDGVERIVLSINGTVPAPTIYADWGDTVGKYSRVPGLDEADRFPHMMRAYANRSKSCPPSQRHARQWHQHPLPRHKAELHQRPRWRCLNHTMPDCSGRLHYV